VPLGRYVQAAALEPEVVARLHTRRTGSFHIFHHHLQAAHTTVHLRYGFL